MEVGSLIKLFFINWDYISFSHLYTHLHKFVYITYFSTFWFRCSLYINVFHFLTLVLVGVSLLPNVTVIVRHFETFQISYKIILIIGIQYSHDENSLLYLGSEILRSPPNSLNFGLVSLSIRVYI